MKEITRKDWQKNPTPRMVWVWNDEYKNKEKRLIVHVFSNESVYKSFVAESKDGKTVIYWKHCAEITEESERMTNYELAKWLADGASCGEFREYKEAEYAGVFSYRSYREEYKNVPCPDNILIRSNGGEWHEPLVEVEE